MCGVIPAAFPRNVGILQGILPGKPCWGCSQVIPGDSGLGGFPGSCRNPGIQKEVWEVSLRGFPWEFQGLFWAPFPEILACFHGKALGAGADPALVPLQPPQNCPGLELMDFTQKSGFTWKTAGVFPQERGLGRLGSCSHSWLIPVGNSAFPVSHSQWEHGIPGVPFPVGTAHSPCPIPTGNSPARVPFPGLGFVLGSSQEIPAELWIPEPFPRGDSGVSRWSLCLGKSFGNRPSPIPPPGPIPLPPPLPGENSLQERRIHGTRGAAGVPWECGWE